MLLAEGLGFGLGNNLFARLARHGNVGEVYVEGMAVFLLLLAQRLDVVVAFHLLFLGGREADGEFAVLANPIESFAGSVLLAFLLGIALSAAALRAGNDDDGTEYGGGIVLLAFLTVEVDADAVFLSPFDEFTLVVDVGVGRLVDVDQLVHDSLLDEAHAVAVAAVEVDGTDEGFEGIAVDVVVVGLGLEVGDDELVEARVLGQLVERLALDDVAARVGEEAFGLLGEVLEDDVTHDGAEYGVAEEFQPLVVDALALLLHSHRLVQHGYLVGADVTRIESQYLAERTVKLPVLEERELYLCYEVLNIHAFDGFIVETGAELSPRTS